MGCCISSQINLYLEQINKSTVEYRNKQWFDIEFIILLQLCGFFTYFLDIFCSLMLSLHSIMVKILSLFFFFCSTTFDSCIKIIILRIHWLIIYLIIFKKGKNGNDIFQNLNWSDQFLKTNSKSWQSLRNWNQNKTQTIITMSKYSSIYFPLLL